MRAEIRKFGDGKKQAIFIAETPMESILLHEVFGEITEGCLVHVKGTVQFSDGYLEHYVRLEKA